MRQPSLQFIAVLFCCLFFLACNNHEPAQNAAENSKPAVPGFSDASNDIKGIAGVYNVSEMLSLCKLDSAPANEVAAKIKADFATLENDFKALGAEANGPQGVIYYNNDPANFKFECLRLIKDMPGKTPEHSKVVVLEAGQMLIYNHYGPYETSFRAYEAIRRYCAGNQLQQAGPMREFYPTDPSEPDTSKWLTRIMVPVKVVNEQDKPAHH